jgi:hypothetical protein
MALAFLDGFFEDEQSIVNALGILKGSTSSDMEKLFRALVVLLTAELEERLAALPPPAALGARATGPMTDADGNPLPPTAKNPQTVVATNAQGFLVDANGSLVDANGNRVAQGVKATG